jgi:hypothetical protein
MNSIFTTSTQRQVARPACFSRGTPLRGAGLQGRDTSTGFRLAQPGSLVQTWWEEPSNAESAACPACSLVPMLFRGCGVGAASPNVWANARTACPDAFSGSGAPNQDRGRSFFPKGHEHVLRTRCWTGLAEKTPIWVYQVIIFFAIYVHARKSILNLTRKRR